MTDAHCHVGAGGGVRELLSGVDFIGHHPWEAASLPEGWFERLAAELDARAGVGVGEIGLDRLRSKTIAPEMRDVFLRQLSLAAEKSRRVVLHGAKCWGEVVKACKPYSGAVPAFLFHGFSRSGGLIPEIVELGGYISVGPAVLNDHALNYRELVRRIPRERLLVETGRSEERAAETPPVAEVAAKVAELLGMDAGELEKLTDENARRFLGEA
jgi:TatD DNase family protein